MNERDGYNIETSVAEMGHDPIAMTARKALDALRSERTSDPKMITIEVFQGWVRSDPKMPDQKLVLTCPDYKSARRLRAKLIDPDVSIVVAHPHNLPFGQSEKIGGVVDAHEASHVGYDADGVVTGEISTKVSKTTGMAHYGDVGDRLRDLAKEVGVLLGVPNVSRPEYLTAEDHEAMKKVLTETLANRANLMGEMGVLVASFAAAGESNRPEEGVYAIHHLEGEIVLNKKEIEEVMNAAGLKVLEMNPGMAPKTQMVAAVSAFKAVLMTSLGGDKFKQVMVDTIIPAAHKALGILDKILPNKQNQEKEVLRAAGIGSRFEGEPDRYVVVARKMSHED